MKTTALITARTTIPAIVVMLIAPLAAHAPGRPSPLLSSDNLRPTFAFFRDYPNSTVKPCLIGYGSCVSRYPSPAFCLASTQGCSADYRVKLANMENR
jgi:hypothetical protein